MAALTQVKHHKDMHKLHEREREDGRGLTTTAGYKYKYGHRYRVNGYEFTFLEV